MTPQERIKADAETEFKSAKIEWSEAYALGRHDGYIAGATAEYERAQVLVDALQALIDFQGPTMVNWQVIKNAKKALQQWNEGKEVEKCAGLPPLPEPILTDEDVKEWEAEQKQPGPAWVKASERLPSPGFYNAKKNGRPFTMAMTLMDKKMPKEYWENVEWLDESALPTSFHWTPATTKPEYNVGVLVFIPGEDNHITSGMWDISKKWVLLDEYRTPECEVTHWMPLPAFPEGYTWNEIPKEIVGVLKEVAKEELGKLTQAQAPIADEWISVDDRLPEEAGRYWCYVQHLTDIGFSYFQWNCDYNPQLRRFSDMTLKDGEQITHWRPLPALPKFKQQKDK